MKTDMKALLSAAKRVAALSAIFAILASSLAACGGGAQTAAAPSATPAPAPQPEPEPTPHERVVSALETIAAKASAWTGANAIGTTGESIGRQLQSTLTSRLNLAGIASNYSPSPARNGVSLAHEELTNQHSVAGWMEHSLLVLSSAIRESSVDSVIYFISDHTREIRADNGLLAPALAGADGARYTWSGAAVAVDNAPASSTFGQVFIGNATVGMDASDPRAANPEIDVSITDLTRHGGTETFPDNKTSVRLVTDQTGQPTSSFRDLSFFGVNGPSLANMWTIVGRFYGPHAQEVGGTFTGGGPPEFGFDYRVTGVFGAKLRP